MEIATYHWQEQAEHFNLDLFIFEDLEMGPLPWVKIGYLSMVCAHIHCLETKAVYMRMARKVDKVVEEILRGVTVI